MRGTGSCNTTSADLPNRRSTSQHARAEPPGRCPACGQAQIRYQGLGTEKLQAEIEEKFPGFVVRRMDSDTMRRPGSHGRVLAAFRRGAQTLRAPS